MKKANAEIVIVGAGLTGLTLAFYLNKAGKKVMLLEKNSRTGGVIETLHHKDFVFEAGPNTGVISNTALVHLFEDLGDEIEVQVPGDASKQRWIWKGNDWHALPSGLMSAVTTPLFSWKDKFRILGEPFRRPGNFPNESVAGLVKRRLGKSFLNYAVDPFISGIYAGDPEQLVTRFALPKLYQLEQTYGSFIKGSVQKAKLPKSDVEKKVSREVFSVKGGLSSLIQVLTKQIPEKQILTDVENIVIHHKQDGYEVVYTQQGEEMCLQAVQVVTTVEANQLSKLFPFLQIPESIANLKYAPVVQAVVCYENWPGKSLQAFGGLVPTIENKEILGILFPASLFEGRAPEKGAVLSVFMGGIKRQELIHYNDDEIRRIVLREIKSMMHTGQEPDHIEILRYPRAIPQYQADSEQRLAAIEEIQQKYAGLWLAGAIRDGIGMADRIQQASKLADEILKNEI